MPVTDDYAVTEESPKTVIERVAIVSREVVGANTRLSLRTIVLFVIALICVTLAQVPFNVIGVVAVGLLALDQATARR